MKYLYAPIRSSWALSSSGWSPSFQPLLIWQFLQALNYLPGPLLHFLQYVDVSPILVSQELGTAPHKCLSSAEQRGRIIAHEPADNTLAQEAIGLLCCKGTLLVHDLLIVPHCQKFKGELLEKIDFADAVDFCADIHTDLRTKDTIWLNKHT